MDIKLPIRLEEVLLNMNYEEIGIGCSQATVYKVFDLNKTYYLKIQKKNNEILREYKVLTWLKDTNLVPGIVEFIKEGEYVYLLTEELKGQMSCSMSNLNNADNTVRLLAEGIKILQNINIDSCSIDATIECKLKCADYNVKNKLVDMDDFEEGNDFATPELLLKWLKENKLKEELVFTHGDYCLPNIFIKDGKINGFIDLGRGGIGDKWQDIALCVRSIKHNFNNDKYVDLFFEYLNVEPNLEKINYYILLDELF